jgi:hypothetical protein
MIGYLEYVGLGTALLAAWLVLWLAFGTAGDGTHLVGIVGAALVLFGAHRRAQHLVRDDAPRAGPRPTVDEDPPATGGSTPVVRLRPRPRPRR